MYICKKCGKVYEDEEVEDVERETYDETLCGFGEPLWKRINVDVEPCSCGSELVKAKECAKCGEWMPDEPCDICENCVAEYETLENVLEIGADYEENFKINGFWASVFDKEEIELILMDALTAREEAFRSKAVKNYCEDDYDYFKGVAEKKWREEK